MFGRRYLGQLRPLVGELRPRATGQLPAGPDWSAHRFGDGVERNPEHVVQHERHSLTGAESLQHFQQCGADLVVEGDPIRGVCAPRLVERGHIWTNVFRPLTAGPGRTDLVEAQPAGYHRQPAADVVDLAQVGTGQPQKRFLRNVFGVADVADVAEHLVGEVDQIRAMAPPCFGEPF